MGNKTKINKEILLVGEGIDEKNFFQALLKSLSLDNDVQIIDYKGKFQFSKDWIDNLFKSADIDVKTLIITMDADNDDEGAYEKIKSALESNNLPIPDNNKEFKSNGNINVGIYILPGTGKGMLETLCLQSIENQPVMQCINAFMTCLNQLQKETKIDDSNRIEKAKVQAYLASLPKDCRSLGEAALSSSWDFNNPSFDDLKQFLYKIKSTQNP